MNQDKLNRAADAEVARDLDRHLARQDRADARAEAVERMAVEVLGDPDHYDGLLEWLAGDRAGRLSAYRVCRAVIPDDRLIYTITYSEAKALREALKEAAHAYADENLEKLLEGGS